MSVFGLGVVFELPFHPRGVPCRGGLTVFGGNQYFDHCSQGRVAELPSCLGSALQGRPNALWRQNLGPGLTGSRRSPIVCGARKEPQAGPKRKKELPSSTGRALQGRPYGLWRQSLCAKHKRASTSFCVELLLIHVFWLKSALGGGGGERCGRDCVGPRRRRAQDAARTQPVEHQLGGPRL